MTAEFDVRVESLTGAPRDDAGYTMRWYTADGTLFMSKCLKPKNGTILYTGIPNIALQLRLMNDTLQEENDALKDTVRKLEAQAEAMHESMRIETQLRLMNDTLQEENDALKDTVRKLEAQAEAMHENIHPYGAPRRYARPKSMTVQGVEMGRIWCTMYMDLVIFSVFSSIFIGLHKVNVCCV